MTIYVGNLPYRMSEDELQRLFEEFGRVDSCKIIMDRMTGRSKGFGFVEMPDHGEATTAITALNGKDFDDRKLSVNEARPK